MLKNKIIIIHTKIHVKYFFPRISEKNNLKSICITSEAMQYRQAP